jgi:hypothetical protein
VTTPLEAFHELSYYTLVQPRDAFIHQHAVDAFAAQTATAGDKPIKLVFALVGLQLHVELGFSGRQVQDFHMKLARRKTPWPELPIPEDRGPMTVHDVLRRPAGPARDAGIHEWCAAVWSSWAVAHSAIRNLTQGRRA